MSRVREQVEKDLPVSFEREKERGKKEEARKKTMELAHGPHCFVMAEPVQRSKGLGQCVMRGRVPIVIHQSAKNEMPSLVSMGLL